MSVVIQVENLSKYYRLGLIGGGTLREDLHRWWAKTRGRPDPLLKIGEEDHGNREGGEIWALRDVSFEVREGEILGIIGRNGAGKSTLLKILSRITAPTSGEVKIKGRVGSLLEVGTGFHPELTGRENIYLNGAILGMKKAEMTRKLDEIVDFAEIAQFIDTPVKRYSSGMYVRLAFAVAAHLEPEILIVDEVLAVGDIAFQKKCLGKMKNIGKEGRTVLFVSHNLIAISALCTSTIVMQKGFINFNGGVYDGVSHYEKSTATLGEASSDENVDRTGNGRLRFVGHSLRNDQGQTVEFAELGRPITVALMYETVDELYDVNVAFNLYEKEDNVLLNFNTADVGMPFRRVLGNGEFLCRIPFFPLREGEYYGNFFCTEGHKIADWIRPGMKLIARDRDIHGTGLLNQQGIFVTKYDWSARG